MLSRYIYANTDVIRNKRVLELGAGLGLPSMVATRCKANFVLATDQKLAIPLLRENIELNVLDFTKIKVIPLDWQNDLLNETFDVSLFNDHSRQIMLPPLLHSRFIQLTNFR